MQSDGYGNEDGRTRHWHQRQRRRTHPGGHKRPCRLCRDIPAQHYGIGSYSPDFGNLRPLCRWCSVFTSAHRLHHYDRGYIIYVPHRPQGGENRIGRGGDTGGTWRCQRARKQVGRNTLYCTNRGGGPCTHTQTAQLHTAEQYGECARCSLHRPHRPQERYSQRDYP